MSIGIFVKSNGEVMMIADTMVELACCTVHAKTMDCLLCPNFKGVLKLDTGDGK